MRLNRRSKTLAAGHRKEIGRYKLRPRSAGLSGLRSGMMIVVFQIAGMSDCRGA